MEWTNKIAMGAISFTFAICLAAPALGRGGGGHSSGGAKTQHVDGYTRKDGTHVDSYYREPKGQGGGSSSGSYASPKGQGEGSSSGSYASTPGEPKSRNYLIVHVPKEKGAPDANGIVRDKDGKIERSEAARNKFMKNTGYPNGRPGYVVDHIIPLKKGGKDDYSNMQWQTVHEAREKDKWE